MSNQINISDIGPIEEFSYEMGEPGLHVLMGQQRAGKTTILRTVQLATDGRTDVKPTKRDGAKRGQAEIAGKTLKISKTVREEGEIDVEGLGELNLQTLHSPNYKDATTRDSYRIKTLASLAGADADISLFYGLLGGEPEFTDVVDVDAVKSTDLVEMAGKVKRAIDKAALYEEKQAEVARANQNAKADQFKGVDMKAPHDESVLNQALTEAIAAQSAIKQERRNAETVLAEAAEARKSLDGQTVVSLADAESERDAALASLNEAKATVAELEKKLAEAKSACALAESKFSDAKERVKSAQAYGNLIAGWQASIEKAESVRNPTDEELAAADKAVEDARAAQSLGVIVRNAVQAKADADEFKAIAVEHEEKASQFRKAAKEASSVVSDAIGRLSECPLRVEYDDDGNARLVIETDRSKSEPFDELSDGERWKVILPLAFKANRLVVLSQAAFGEISPANRELIDSLAREHGCYVLTAQVDDGELRAMPYAELFAAAS